MPFVNEYEQRYKRAQALKAEQEADPLYQGYNSGAEAAQKTLAAKQIAEPKKSARMQALKEGIEFLDLKTKAAGKFATEDAITSEEARINAEYDALEQQQMQQGGGIGGLASYFQKTTPSQSATLQSQEVAQAPLPSPIAQPPQAQAPTQPSPYGEKRKTPFDPEEFVFKTREAARISEAAKEPARQIERQDKAIQPLNADFAKDYNDWTSTGKSSAAKNIELLETSRNELQKAIEEGDNTVSGRAISLLPDRAKPTKAITIRDNVRQAAQAALKAALGNNFTEKEGERIMNAAYNETLSPEENLKKIDLALKEIYSQVHAKDHKSKYFESTGTLQGYKSPEVEKYPVGSKREKNGQIWIKTEQGWVPQ